MVDRNVAEKIVRHISLTESDRVIEIGPGRGMLTRLVAPRVHHVTAIEIDQRLIPDLAAEFDAVNNVTLLNQDFLSVDLETVTKPVRIIGNIPYQITSPIVFKVIDYRQGIQDITLLIQREVADRIVASPRTKEYGILSVISQTYADPKYLMTVSRHVFAPAPVVESALVRWTLTNERARAIRSHELYRTLVRTAFGQRRKMLRNSLKDWLHLPGIDPSFATKRPEELGCLEWIRLCNDIVKAQSESSLPSQIQG